MDGEETERTPRSILRPQPTSLEVVKQQSKFSREDHALYLSLADQLMAEKDPVNAGERALVDEIALNYVRLQRARRLETNTLNRYVAEVQAAHSEPLESGKALAMVFMEHGQKLEAMQRKEVKIENAWYRAMAELDRAQTARRKTELQNPDDPSKSSDSKATRIHLVQPKK